MSYPYNLKLNFFTGKLSFINITGKHVKDDTNMTSIKIVQFSRPHPRCIATSKIPPSPWPWTSNFKQTSLPLQMITNQRKHNHWMTTICYQVFPSGRLSFSVSNLFPNLFFVFLLWRKDALGSWLCWGLTFYCFCGFRFLGV